MRPKNRGSILRARQNVSTAGKEDQSRLAYTLDRGGKVHSIMCCLGIREAQSDGPIGRTAAVAVLLFTLVVDGYIVENSSGRIEWSDGYDPWLIVELSIPRSI